MTRCILVALSLALEIQAQPLPERASAVIKANCLACHGAAKMSGLDLRSREAMLAGGERGPALVPGKAEESRLYRFAAGLDKPTMPPGKTLPADQLAVVKEWIAAGANFTELKDDAAAVLSKLEERPVTAEEKSFWAFRPVIRSELPKNKQTNPIDAFLIAAIREKNLQVAPPANRRALVRRAYLDLVGLPPTVAQVEKFVNDPAPDAFAKVVEDLLASPHYGERWGRHWLDLIRYADSGGFEFDRDKPNAWRFRDYVIRAFNRDKPYDRFVREQLAGDEFPETGTDGRIGVGPFDFLKFICVP